jgi:N utilization substance protein B
MSDTPSVQSDSKPLKTHSTAQFYARRSRARGFVIQALYQSVVNPEPAYILLAQFETRFDMSRADVPYFQDMVRGVLANTAALDALMMPCLDRSISELDPISISILRLASFELQNQIEIPYKVVINEAVELAKKFGPEQSSSFVNAVADQLAKQVRGNEYVSGSNA